jgi:hypothetical protein
VHHSPRHREAQRSQWRASLPLTRAINALLSAPLGTPQGAL